jgi:hypothetical protein
MIMNTLYDDDSTVDFNNIIDGIIKRGLETGIVDIELNSDTLAGFKAISRKTGETITTLGTTGGIYTYYMPSLTKVNSYDPVYVGSSVDDIRHRLYIYIKEVLGVCGRREHHSAGKKHRFHYGKDLTGLCMMYSPYRADRKELEEFEYGVMRRIRPLFNDFYAMRGKR